MTAAVPVRSEVAREETWALEDVYPTDAAWEEAFAAADAGLAALPPFAGRVGDSAGVLLAALRASDAVGEAVTRVSVWSGCAEPGGCWHSTNAPSCRMCPAIRCSYRTVSAPEFTSTVLPRRLRVAPWPVEMVMPLSVTEILAPPAV